MDQEAEHIRRIMIAAKDPSTYPILTYLWVIILSAWGGLVRFLMSLREKNFTLKEALCELFIGATTSVFVGIITFYMCEAAEFEPLWTAICVAMTGHMGAEGLAILRKILKQRLFLKDPWE